MNIFNFEMKRQVKGLFWWTLILAGFLLMYLAAFPSMKDLAMAKFDALPEEMLAAFNIDMAIDLGDFNQYFGMIYTYMLLALGCYAAILGTNALSREENEGTIEFLNSQAVTRTKIVTSKLLASLVALGIVGAGLTAAAVLGGSMFSDGAADNMAMFAVIKVTFMPVLVYLGLGFLLSTIVPRSAKGSSIALALFFGTYLAGVISSLVENLEFLKWLSPMQYATTNDVLESSLALGDTPFAWGGVILGFVITALALVAAYTIYQRKDLHSK